MKGPKGSTDQRTHKTKPRAQREMVSSYQMGSHVSPYVNT